MRRILRHVISKLQSQKNKWYNLKFQYFLWLNGIRTNRVYTCKGCPIIEIQDGAKLNLGENIWFNNYLGTGWYSRCMIRVRDFGTLTIGNNSGLNSVLISCDNSITIGSNVLVGGGTRIFDSDFHDLDWKNRGTSNESIKTSPILIENNVFIGTNCIIGKGVHIGARSIIAAGSVVVKDIPKDCIAAGNPCKVIRYLYQANEEN